MANEAQQRSALYCGPDLVNAADQSYISRSMEDRFAGLVNGLSVVSDKFRYRRKRNGDRSFEVVTVSGPIRGTTETVSVAYAGNGPNRNWCLGITISERSAVNSQQMSSAEEVLDALREIKDQVDVLFVEGLGDDLESTLQTNFIRTPSWIKQRVRIAGDWQAQIRTLKRNTRQEISRLLRKYGFECRLSSRERDIRRFYDEQYQPYISALYGEAAIIVDRDRFIRECRRGVLLQLVYQEAVVATALLRPIGRSMAVVWTGMDRASDDSRVPGATDTLDYFSLLYAHLTGCRWLDFGPSRPDLCDGTLRYKRKWGAEIHAGLFAQPSISWTCRGKSSGVREFLKRHAFISNDNSTLRGLAFLDDDEAEIQRSHIEHLVSHGISDYRVIALSPLHGSTRSDLERIQENISVIEADSIEGAMQIAATIT